MSDFAVGHFHYSYIICIVTHIPQPGVTMYNKLFTKILDSSIWLAPDPHRLVWITLIAAMDQNGLAQFACAANLAARARVSLEETESAIAAFEAPDPLDPTQEYEGRRIERVPGGWFVLNAEKYRSMVTRAVATEQSRERMRRYREKLRNVTQPLQPVTPSVSDAVSVSEANKKKERSHFVPPTLDQVTEFMREQKRLDQALKFFTHYESNGWKVGKNPMKKWKAAAAGWLTRDFDSGVKGAQPVYTGWNEHKDLVIGPPSRQRIYDQAKAKGMNFESQEHFDGYCAEVLRTLRA